MMEWIQIFTLAVHTLRNEDNMKKNEAFTMTVEDIGVGGEGIGKADGYTLFVKDTIPGDIIKGIVTKAGPKYGYGRLTEIIEPSKDRIEARCPVARSCGGCQIQEMAYEKQLSLKKRTVKNSLDRIGGLSDYVLFDTIGCESPFRYRNKAQFPVGRNRDGKITAGFFAGRTHHIIECRDCQIGIEENQTILDIIIHHMECFGIEPYNEKTHTGLVRYLLIRKGFHTGEIMLCLVINGDSIKEQELLVSTLRERIPALCDISLNINKKKINTIMGKHFVQLYGNGYISDFIGGIQFRISPKSFYQVNPKQTEVLYGKALEYAALTGKETVFDLYCGVGTISLFLAKSAAKVYGVEVVPEAIADAKVNAALNGIDNVEFLTGKAEDIIPSLYAEEGVSADVVVLDPPRKGCDEKVLETIATMKPKRIVYVSCNPATLARDLKYLAGEGWRVEMVQPLDMFANTVHVECVVLMSRVEK